ncbi:MAG: 2-C-methyl-D-erythritol 4-phosphate cytidylyltransferase [Chthoniobacteraceae bacterium]
MIAVMVAAGGSRRMGFDKLSADLAGKPVVAHSLLAFEASAKVERIVLVTREERIAEFEAMGREFGVTKLAKVVAGGTERHYSVWNGLQAAEAKVSDYVAVHDAARPLVTPAVIEACLTMAERHGAASCAAPVADTLKKADAAGAVIGSVDRAHLWAMQTPQIFLWPLLERAYRQVLRTETLVTDEVSAIQRLGLSVFLSPVDEPNFKITVPRDLELARLVIEARATS